MRRSIIYIVLPGLGLALAACGERSVPAQDKYTPSNTAPAQTSQPAPPPEEGASARMSPTEGNQVSGMLAVVAAPGGVRISGALEGLKPDSEFGFHIHEKGDCSAPDASSAGSHFNPGGKPHGHPERGEHHAGDMVNIRSDAEGAAQVDALVNGVTFQDGGPTDVFGKAIVVHAKPDDYTTQPSGGSGDRIACGVIE